MRLFPSDSPLFLVIDAAACIAVVAAVSVSFKYHFEALYFFSSLVGLQWPMMLMVMELFRRYAFDRGRGAGGLGYVVICAIAAVLWFVVEDPQSCVKVNGA